jgi:hypothetical protein
MSDFSGGTRESSILAALEIIVKINRQLILGLCGILLFIPGLRAQDQTDQKVSGSIWYFEEYAGGMICRVPASEVGAVNKIIGTDVRGTDGKILGALGDLAAKEDDIECYDAKPQDDNYDFALPLKPDSRMVIIFLTGDKRHPSYYEVDSVPVKRQPGDNQDVPDIVVYPPHDGGGPAK